MNNDRNAFKAGLFIVISVALIIAVIVGIKGAGEFIEPDQVRTAHFKLEDDVGGLRLGDDVRVGGLKVGIVRSIKVEQATDAGDAHIAVSFNIPRRLTLRQGAIVAVQNTLTGTSWLNFDNLGSGAPLPANGVLDGTPSTFTTLSRSVGVLGPEIQKLAAELRTITLPKVNNTFDSAGATLGDARARIDGIITQYNKVTNGLAGVFADIRDIFGDTKPDIRRLLANTAGATEALKEKLPPVLDNFDATLRRLREELESTSGVLAELKQTATNTREATGSARSLLVSNRSKIDDMIASLKTAGDNLKFATAEIRHSPWRLLYKPKPGEVANLNLYDATRQFAEGANELSTAATALRDALNDPQADQARIGQLVEQLDRSFGQFQKVENDLWQRVKD